jgi:hypothetical protein
MCFALQVVSLMTPFRIFSRTATSAFTSGEDGSSFAVSANAVVAETIARMIAAAHATVTQSAIKLNQNRFGFIMRILILDWYRFDSAREMPRTLGLIRSKSLYPKGRSHVLGLWPRNREQEMPGYRKNRPILGNSHG